MAQYRAGKLAESAKTLREVIDLEDRTRGEFSVAARLYLAMALYDLKRPAEAKKWLAQAAERLDRKPPAEWYDQAHLQALRRQAEMLILGKES
jgi:hypothetical protein